jgi:hypothetical protein
VSVIEMVHYLRLLGFPTLAVSAFLLFAGIGAWFDANAENSWKNEIRSSLKKGAWLVQFSHVLRLVSMTFFRIFGRRLLSRKSAIACTLVSFCTGVLLLIFVWLPNFIRHVPTDALNYFLGITTSRTNTFPLEPGEPYVLSNFGEISRWIGLRFATGLILDYLTFLRLVVLMRFIINRPRPLLIAVSILSDLVFVVLVSAWLNAYVGSHIGYVRDEVVEQYTENLESQDALTRLLVTFPPAIRIYREVGAVIVNPRGIDAIFMYVSLVPSLIFYFCCASFLVLLTVSRLSPAVEYVSARLKFQRPFTTIGRFAGLLCAGVLSLML